jgi:thiol:disulfide interchange protein
MFFNYLVDHIIGNIPVWIWPMAFGGSVSVYFLAHLLSRLPQIKPWAYIIKPLAVLACLASVFMWGSSGITEIWQAQIQAQQAKIDASVKESKSANTQLAQVRKQKNKVIVQRQVIIHERIVKDAAKMDATCRVDPVAIKDLNDAAINPEVKK